MTEEQDEDKTGSSESAPEPVEQQDDTPQVSPEPKKSRSWAGGIALLFSLIALGGTGYLYYRAVYDNPLSSLQTELSSQDAAIAGVREELTTALAEQKKRVAQELDGQAKTLKATESSIAASLREAIDQGPPTTDQWKLAEVEYLLRIANHRLLMERDARGSAGLLGAADQILAELDDFSLHPVRAQLADEMLSLRALGETDLQGLFLRIEAVKGKIDSLPLHLPEYFTDEKTETEIAEETGFVDALTTQLAKFFTYRTLTGPESVRPILSPTEASFLEMNLRLSLERAQLALMRRQTIVYSQSIGSALDWVTNYLDTDDLLVKDVQEELGALVDIDLSMQLPDISGSLNTLLDMRGAQS